ncbi:expressed unknown protein [Seminavis robusta]|uniref:ShKT domain-containing protein n=1 Tax=Seminavis robusta TaxID=568900 RepID=A0A9N8EX81_9STRA|nr:expressed unknown protein [Seminavis robusta]|eukprot:Sro1822_g299850.1 n/a (242) ;mRNA; f:14072-14908
MKKPSRLSPVVLLLVSCLRSPLLVAGTFQWDKDSLDDCHQREEAGQCTTDSVTFYQCPMTCTKNIKAEGMRKQGEAEDPEDFFELKTPLANGKMLKFEKFEGYVTTFVVIPLFPGMAQYYFDMMEHLHKVYPFTLEIVVLPIRIDTHPDVKLTIPAKTKITVLPEIKREAGSESLAESNNVLEYLEQVIFPGADFIFTDRVTAYFVAYNAGFVEKEDSPTLDFMERLVVHYQGEMEWKQEF